MVFCYPLDIPLQTNVKVTKCSHAKQCSTLTIILHSDKYYQRNQYSKTCITAQQFLLQNKNRCKQLTWMYDFQYNLISS